MKRIYTLVLIVIFSFISGCSRDHKQELIIFHAGSLSVPFKMISQEFEKENPGIFIRRESAGSRTCARKISDLKRPADIVASADSEVIRTLLMPDYADFCIDFSTNEMALMYEEKSKYSGRINSKNWYEILLDSEVEYGHSDPNSDPCGYRTRLSWKLAEKYYKRSGLFDELVKNCPPANIRPKEVDLIALLETGELDYVFIYRSVAEQHQGEYIILPDEINLKSPGLADLYSSVSVELSGKKPGEIITRKGAPMVYGVTIPKSAPHPSLAVNFLNFLFSDKGKKILEDKGQPQMDPPIVDNFNMVPAGLKKVIKKK